MDILFWIIVFVVTYFYIGMVFETFLEEKGYLFVETFKQFVIDAFLWPILLFWYIMDKRL